MKHPFFRIAGLCLLCCTCQFGCNFSSNNASSQSSIEKRDLVESIRERHYDELNKYELGTKGVNLMDPFSSHYHPINTEIMDEKFSLYNSVALKIFKNSLKKGHHLFSLVSTVYSMAVVANAADSNTLSEIEKTFEISCEELNEYLNTYLHAADYNSGGRFKIYNSIWLNKDKNYHVNDELLQLNANIYHNDVYSTKFDQKAVQDINTWAYTRSTSIVDFLMSEVSEDDSMYLMNVSFFEGKWRNMYSEDQVKENRHFVSADGKRVPVKMLHSHEAKYLNNERAKGFIKFYENSDYAFVALLPNEGTDIMDYVNTMDGDELNYMLSTSMNIDVIVEIPIFSVQDNLDLEEVLKDAGMNDVFDPECADLDKLGKGENGENLFVSRALNKYYFSVDKRGTKSGMDFSAEDDCGKMVVDALKKEVVLDRPFMYMLVDTRYNIPVLMGVLTDVE